MKVLHLLGQDEDIGGVLSVIRNLQEATLARGWIHVVWVNAAYKESRQPPLAYRYSRRICDDSPNHFRILIGALRAFFEFKRLIAGEPFDVIHAHTRGALVVGLLASRWLGLPIVYTNHSFSRRVGMYRWAAAQPRIHTVVLTPSMARHYGLSPALPRVHVISACCSDHFFNRPLASRLDGRHGGRPLRFIGLGNIVRWKNWHLILEAMRRLGEQRRGRIEFIHWGPTPNDPDSIRYHQEVLRWIDEFALGKSAFFRGPSNRVEDCLRDADWFILPSTNEPCSVALMEALALGLPALVSASGGNVDILADGKSGLLFQPDDPADLAGKMRAILDGEPGLLTPLEIRDTVRSRSASAVAERYEELYRSVQRPAPEA